MVRTYVNLPSPSCAGGVDYEDESPYVVEFMSSSLSASLGVTIYMDNTTEQTELFAAVLTVPTPSYNLGVRPGIADNATVEIQDTNEGMYVYLLLYALHRPHPLYIRILLSQPLQCFLTLSHTM